MVEAIGQEPGLSACHGTSWPSCEQKIQAWRPACPVPSRGYIGGGGNPGRHGRTRLSLVVGVRIRETHQNDDGERDWKEHAWRGAGRVSHRQAEGTGQDRRAGECYRSDMAPQKG